MKFLSGLKTQWSLAEHNAPDTWEEGLFSLLSRCMWHASRGRAISKFLTRWAQKVCHHCSSIWLYATKATKTHNVAQLGKNLYYLLVTWSNWLLSTNIRIPTPLVPNIECALSQIISLVNMWMWAWNQFISSIIGKTKGGTKYSSWTNSWWLDHGELYWFTELLEHNS